MKNCKTFCKAQVVSHLKEVIRVSYSVKLTKLFCVARAYYFQCQVS